MKQIMIVALLLFASLLAGCTADPVKIENAVYLDSMRTKDTVVVMFLTEEGEEKALLWDPYAGNPFVKGEKYNVTFTVEDTFNYGDCITDFEHSEGVEE